MAEKRKRRQKKSLGGPNPYAGLPSPKLDFSRDPDTPEPMRVENPEAAAEKAKELLAAQRKSVNMLTMVKERIKERLGDVSIREKLQTDGFAIIDGFLGEDEAAGVILSQLEEEGKNMLEKGCMEIDTANIGKGQYVVPIEGGEEQYATCPRMVEIIVSGTKHVPEVFGKSDEDTSADQESEEFVLDLDTSACMATLRTFDRKALMASLTLLTGNNDDSALDTAAEETPLAVIADSDDDKRRLSLHFFIVPDEWNENCGGGLEFEGGIKVNAKKDRLVVFSSNTTKCKSIPWKGSDDTSHLTIGNS
eukprot:CAMPEP_0197188090 /NCGR_PEP_ID=MMETSP1423-20130617/17205_1 /TAXON_ID=476441 /ORGANISM="Pseudo-nitzschia heimii, Strain UNC1101" /LENGTH=305 /DNA_ID=CAMNT_0042639843 /DNA_START=243 /DNA_END=1156 /DNA_ORIENTATION=-